MNLRAVLFASAFVPAAAFAAVGDPCTPDEFDADGNQTADNFTERCDNTDLIVCAAPADGQPEVETAVACATFGGITGGTCGTIAGGADPTCKAPDGQGCFFSTADGSQSFLIPCATEDSGCIDGVCTAGQGACTPPAEGAEPPLACATDLIDFGCAFTHQQLQLSCALLGVINGAPTPSQAASCSGAGDTLKCVGAATGDSCATGFIECGADDCVGESQTSFGTCGSEGEGEASEGEGEDEDDDGGNGRDDEPEAAPSGCFNAYGTIPALAPLALVLVALRRRRRA